MAAMLMSIKDRDQCFFDLKVAMAAMLIVIFDRDRHSFELKIKMAAMLVLIEGCEFKTAQTVVTRWIL
jgi:hypothetical protein